MSEVRCGDCGRPVFDGTDTDEMGWIARCGRRISRFEACGTNVCEQIGALRFDVDGALLSEKQANRPL